MSTLSSPPAQAAGPARSLHQHLLTSAKPGAGKSPGTLAMQHLSNWPTSTQVAPDYLLRMAEDLPPGALVDHVVEKALERGGPWAPWRPKGPRLPIPTQASATAILDGPDGPGDDENSPYRPALITGARNLDTVRELLARRDELATSDRIALAFNPIAQNLRLTGSALPAQVLWSGYTNVVVSIVWAVMEGLDLRRVALPPGFWDADSVAHLAKRHWVWDELSCERRRRLVEAAPGIENTDWADNRPETLRVQPRGLKDIRGKRAREGRPREVGRALYERIGEDPGLWEVAIELMDDGTKPDDVWLDTVSSLR